MRRVLLATALTARLGACAPVSPPASLSATAITGTRTLADDLAFLSAHAPVVVLEAPSGGRVVVSPSWQGRVMTSAVDAQGASLGFVCRDFIEKGRTGTPFDDYGGEDRFWLGPEGGQFGLYFAPGAPFTIDAWQVPHGMQEGTWDVGGRDAGHVVMRRTMHVRNWSGAEFDVGVDRTVRVLVADEVAHRSGIAPGPDAKWVAFESVNRITNVGATAWTPDRGLLSIWILGMYPPSSDARVVVPFAPGGEGPIVHDAYFGPVPPERLRVHADQGWLSFQADAQYRSKIGIPASRSRGVLGSYSPSARLLTIVASSGSAPAPHGWVNSLWKHQYDPYGGDAINSYDDGPTAPGQPSLGGFYEIETSSPAAALAPGESISHTQTTLHVVGSPEALEPVARAALGVSLQDVAHDR